MSEPTDLNARKANDLLRDADEGTTAKERGYSHGELPGESRRGHKVSRLTAEHWQNVGGFRQADEVSDDEEEEARREAGAYSDQMPDDPARAKLRPKTFDPRSLLGGWSGEAQAAYFLGRRHSGVWNDQAFARHLERLKRRLPPPMPCAVCDTVFQPERRTALYCSDACKSRARRARERHAKSRCA